MEYSSIVLKNYFPHRRCLSVLDWELGRVDGFVRLRDSQSHFATGYIVSYAAQYWSGRVYLTDISTVKAPTIHSVDDLSFLHRLFGICLAFIPIGQPAQEVIEFFHSLYFSIDETLSSVRQQLIICRLFGMLGLFPEGPFTQSDLGRFQYIMQVPVDRLLSIYLELETEKLLQAWMQFAVAFCDEHRQVQLTQQLLAVN